MVAASVAQRAHHLSAPVSMVETLSPRTSDVASCATSLRYPFVRVLTTPPMELPSKYEGELDAEGRESRS
jgi:hypothetical protein